MTGAWGWLLLVVFGLHLAAFARLWWRRRQGYYVALVVTFSLLTASVAIGLWSVSPDIAGRPLAACLRFAAWVAAAVSIGWTLLRLSRRRQVGRQNCS